MVCKAKVNVYTASKNTSTETSPERNDSQQLLNLQHKQLLGLRLYVVKRLAILDS